MEINKNRSLIIFKPDCIQKQLVGQIISILEKNYEFKYITIKQLNKTDIYIHYNHLIDKDFFHNLLTYMIEIPVIISILQHKDKSIDTVSSLKTLIGVTDPSNATQDTIRGKYGKRDKDSTILKNLIHCSDSIESAVNEINYFATELLH